MKYFILISFTFYSFFSFSQEISSTRMMNDIRYLSSEELEGRWPGTKGDSLTASYIKNEFIKAGLSPINNDFFQIFPVVTGKKPGRNNQFKYKNENFVSGTDFIPISFSNDTNLCADLCFAGYGINSKEHNDFKKTDIKNKWAVILYDIPADLIHKVKISLSLRARALDAAEKGASGVIFIYNGSGDFPETFMEKTSSSVKMPVIAVKENVFTKILSSNDAEILKTTVGKKKPVFTEHYEVCITTDIDNVEVNTANVIGCVYGSDSILKKEYIIIGGHHDHLGKGGYGSGSRKPELKGIHYGADDNASGTAGVMELARYYSNKPTKRTIVFLTFAAEEQGLLGSKYFVNNPPVDLSKVSAMINFDMIGRMDTLKKSVSVSGTGSAIESDSILRLYEDSTLFKLKLRQGAGGGSDHASFYRKNIPVLFFITGMHDDYHTPSDTWEKIDSAGMENILKYNIRFIDDIANRVGKLKFKEAEQSQTSENRHGGNNVTLGIVPDISDSSGKGLKVEGVRKSGPADKAGIKKDDRIVSINGKNISGIQDYMIQLSNLKKGGRATIELIRFENGMEKKEKLRVQL